MALITGVSIQNFKCYRKKQSFSLNKSTFFVGSNNSGKSAVLKALHCFFDDREFVYDYVNKTELRSKAEGANRSIIEVEFNVNDISSKTMRESLIASYTDNFTISKHFIFREKSNTVSVEYHIGTDTFLPDQLPEKIQKLLRRIVVSYIHPQEAKQLLQKAQDKLKTRLISNWGKTANLGVTLRQLQKQWDSLRNKANSYLSNGLTQNLQSIWPGCETRVNLPEKIQDVIGISEIMFKGSKEQSDISLTSQGTGAQSTILFQTHFLLDSDKTLHRGFYYPIWLIEEPESFLHGDIIFKLGALLCSHEWLSNIQMLVSTHSPLLLSSSKKSPDSINWYLLSNYSVQIGKPVSNWSTEEISKIGQLMGDTNFEIYFHTSDRKRHIIIEDKRKNTADKYIESGIDITLSLSGNGELKKYFEVLRKTNTGKNVFFLVDGDEGLNDFNHLFTEGNCVKKTKDGFFKYEFENGVHLITFPSGCAAEELYREYNTILENCAKKIFNSTFTKPMTQRGIPPHLTRAHAAVRNKSCNSLDEAKKLLRKEQDVKDHFWAEVANKSFQIDPRYVKQIRSLLS